MSAYGNYARMLNDLYFLNLDSVSTNGSCTKLHRSLACSKCKRVFRKPYGLERHFKLVHSVDHIDFDLEQPTQIERGATTVHAASQEEVVQESDDTPMDVNCPEKEFPTAEEVTLEETSEKNNPTTEDESAGQSAAREEESPEQDAASSSSSEPLISSEEGDATQALPRRPVATQEVILLSSDDENDDDDAFVDNSQTSSVIDSEAETLAEGDNGNDDSGFESSKASSPPAAGKALPGYDFQVFVCSSNRVSTGCITEMIRQAHHIFRTAEMFTKLPYVGWAGLAFGHSDSGKFSFPFQT